MGSSWRASDNSSIWCYEDTADAKVVLGWPLPSGGDSSPGETGLVTASADAAFMVRPRLLLAFRQSCRWAIGVTWRMWWLWVSWLSVGTQILHAVRKSYFGPSGGNVFVWNLSKVPVCAFTNKNHFCLCLIKFQNLDRPLHFYRAPAVF